MSEKIEKDSSPFEKWGPGGISEAIHLKNPPRSLFSKGGGIIFVCGRSEFKKDTVASTFDVDIGKIVPNIYF